MTAERSVVVERLMPHPPQKIWRALTQGPLIEEWLMKTNFEPRLGHKFNFRTDPMPQWNGVLDCEVLALEPHETVSYSWNASGAEAANGLKTVVTWTLTPTEGGTLVRMEQSGFRAEEEANYQGALYGWRRNLAGLERVVGGLA
ncbi:SRPBCC family protein [Labrys okinawensis]|uniref:SRPBCC family protein n=1 Tax=Labrys okinawensis TaxID=346911 RepID=UPI0039BCED66